MSSAWNQSRPPLAASCFRLTQCTCNGFGRNRTMLTYFCMGVGRTSTGRPWVYVTPSSDGSSVAKLKHQRIVRWWFNCWFLSIWNPFRIVSIKARSLFLVFLPISCRWFMLSSATSSALYWTYHMICPVSCLSSAIMYLLEGPYPSFWSHTKCRSEFIRLSGCFNPASLTASLRFVI